MPILSHQKYMLPVLEALSKNEELQHSEICSRVAKYERQHQRLTIGEEKLRYEISGALIFEHRIRWAVQDLNNAKLVQRARHGVYKITADGRKVHAKIDVSIGIDKEWLQKNCPSFSRLAKKQKLLRKQRSSVPSDSKLVNVDADQHIPTEQMENAYLEIKDRLANDLLVQIRSEKMKPKRFEQLALDLLTKMLYGNRGFTCQTGGSNDRGLDGYISEDVLGLRKTYVQAKRIKEKPISLKDAQRFTGALQETGASKGVFITTAPRFSNSAKKHIETIEQRHNTVIVCIDGPKLTDLMIQYNIGVKNGTKYIVKKIDLNDYFDDEDL